jgi:predicted LPLAT superfamily acyltransferase/glycosyltransferase involved in cell wall biosynthesis
MILRICVVIPTFDNSRTISEVVKDVVMTTPHSILVVDDGSETPVSNVLYSWDVRQALEEGRVRVLRFEKNQGKGAAIKFAINDLVQRGFTHMVTMDADSQHHGYEISKLTELAKKNPWDLIIGNRRLKSENVPEISKFGRKFSNFWVQYQTGLHIKDSQSGFRLYPLLPLQTMKFYTSHYDFEIEVLIRMLWAGVHVRETEIDVFYPEKAARVSHFNKLWDNVRISALNTLLVVVSLFKTHRSPRELASALGIGVFIGCSPFYGFHTLLVAGAAFALRLNVVMMWVGSHVSTPIIAPLVVWAEIWIARHWLGMGGGAAGAGAKHDFMEWMAGSLVLGVGLGVLTAAVSYGLAWYYQNRRPPSNWTGRTRGGRLGNGFLKRVLKYGGIEHGYMCLMFVIPYFYLFAPRARRGLNEYWKINEPGDTWRQRQLRIFRHFYRFGQVLMDRVYQGFHKEKKFSTTHSGSENINGAVKEGQGLILLSAHMGAWDLAAALLPANGFSDQLHVVEFKSEGFSFQNVKSKMDPSHVHSLDSAKSGDAIFEIHQALKSGRCIGLMGDRPMADRFELIPFMGRIAPFDVTPFRMAAALRVPLLFTFGFKGVKQHYDFYARPARVYTYSPDLPREVQLFNWAKEYAADVEHFIRMYPDEWFNFYPFWSALPTAPDGGLGALTNNHMIEELPAVARAEISPGLEK